MTEQEADMMNFFVVLSYIILLVSCGKLSDTFPHRIDLMKIGLAGTVCACPSMFAIFQSESKMGYFLGQIQYVCCLALVNGGMAAFEVELWMADPSLSFTGVAVGHNVASTIFSGTMPLVATFLYFKSEDLIESEDDLWPRIIPGVYVSLLGCLSIYCITVVIRHPHDVRTGEKVIRTALEKERKKSKRNKKSLKKKKKQLECYWNEGNNEAKYAIDSNSSTGQYAPPLSIGKE